MHECYRETPYAKITLFDSPDLSSLPADAFGVSSAAFDIAVAKEAFVINPDYLGTEEEVLAAVEAITISTVGTGWVVSYLYDFD